VVNSEFEREKDFPYEMSVAAKERRGDNYLLRLWVFRDGQIADRPDLARLLSFRN